MLSVVLSLGAIVSLIAPLCGGIIALVRVHDEYYTNTIRILGRMFILTACGMAILGAIGALARGEQPIWPYLVITGLPAIAVARIMHMHSEPGKVSL